GGHPTDSDLRHLRQEYQRRRVFLIHPSSFILHPSRVGLTLLEVLISIFIMALGMLALLTLFPLGALSMARALQEDRAASAANLAAEYAQALDLRHDPNVTAAFTAAPPGYAGPARNPAGPSWPVFVDPFGAAVNPNPLGASPSTPGIPRVRPSYAPTLPL